MIDKINKKRGVIWLLAAMIAAAIAQTVLFFGLGTPPSNLLLWIGLSLYVLAGFFFIRSLRSLADVLPPFAVSLEPSAPKKPRVLLWAISLSLSSVIAVYATHAGPNDARGYLFTGLWLLSIGVAVFAVLREINWQPSGLVVKDWFKKHRLELLAITLIVVAAFVIRIVDIELFPYSFNNDEGNVGSSATCIVQGGCKNFFVIDWAAQPELAYLAYAISIGVFGKTALAVRLVSVITGSLSVLAVYLLARETFGRKIAWMAAILLTTLPVHIHFSRMGVDNIIDSLTTPLMLWLLLRGSKRSSRLSFLAAGVLAGLCLYTYPGSLLAPAFGGGALGLFTLRTRGFARAQAENFVVFVLAAIIVVTPIFGYYSTHPDFFMARMKRDGIFQNGNLEKSMLKTGQSAAETMLQQFSKASLVYIATGAPGNFFNSPKAYLPPIEAALLMFGLAYLLWRIKDPRCLILFIWLWTVVILGSALTNYPPASQRVLMSMPALVMIIALSLSKILDVLSKLGPPAARWLPVGLLGLILFINYSNLNYYFYEYRIGHYYEDPKDELTYESRIYTQPLHQLGRVFLLANPKDLYLTYKSFDYFAPDVEKHPFDDVSRQALLKLPYDKYALFIALPGYEDELQQIVQAIPSGEWREVKRRYQPKSTLFYSYKVSRAQLAVFTRFANGYEIFRIFPNESQTSP